MRRPNRPSHIAIAHMVAQIVEIPSTVRDMADRSGMTEQTVRGYVRALRRLRCLHIAGWEHDAAGRQSLAVYAIGRKPDARRTAPRTRAQIARDYRARAKAARLLGLMKETA